MKVIGISLLVLVVGYTLGVVLGMLAVNLFSTNRQDKALEAAMTSFFFAGPAVAILSVIGFWLIRVFRR